MINRRVLQQTIIVVAFVCCPPSARSHERVLTIDDVLRMEDVGHAVIANNDRAVVYEQTGPYAEAPNLGAVQAWDDRRALGKLYVAKMGERGAPLAAPSLLFPQDPRGGYWIASLSPDGLRIAIYSLVNGEFRTGVFEFATDRVIWFAFTPAHHRLHQSPVWLSNHELLYPVMPVGELPDSLYRLGLATRLQKLWKMAFEGREPSSTVIASTSDGTFAADAFRPGALMKVDARTGATEKVADGFFYDFHLSSDRRYLAALMEGGAVQPDPAVPFAGVSDAQRTKLVIFDLQAAFEPIEPCKDCNVAIATLEWSADGKTLVFFSRPVGQPMDAGQFLRYSPADHLLERVELRGLRIACGRISWRPRRAVGARNRLFVYGREDTTARTRSTFSSTQCERARRHDWFLVDERGDPVNLTAGLTQVSGELVGIANDAIFVAADGAVWRLGVDGSRQNLTHKVRAQLVPWGKGLEPATYSEEVRNLGSPLSTDNAVMQSDTTLAIIDLRRGTVAVKQKPEPNVELIDIAKSARAALYVRRRPAPTRLLLVKDGSAAIGLASVNHHLSSIREGREIELRYEYKGEKLTSCAILPPSQTARTPHPAVIWVYPGLGGQCTYTDLVTFNPYNMQLLAARGYAVVFANTSRRLIETVDGPTQGIASAVHATVDAAIDAGYIDGTRLGLLGLSQGHHSVLQVLTESSRFRAAVVSHGVSDFIGQYGSILLSTRLSWSPFAAGGTARFEHSDSDNYLGAKPWEDPQRYVINSPVFRADAIRTPVLIIHSDFDAFGLDQSGEIFSAMYRLRKEATYVTYWGEGHGTLSPGNVRDMWKRIFEWYDRKLGKLD